MKHLVIIGGGFAGFWSAMSAVRQARELGKFEELDTNQRGFSFSSRYRALQKRIFLHSKRLSSPSTATTTSQKLILLTIFARRVHRNHVSG